MYSINNKRMVIYVYITPCKYYICVHNAMEIVILACEHYIQVMTMFVFLPVYIFNHIQTPEKWVTTIFDSV